MVTQVMVNCHKKRFGELSQKSPVSKNCVEVVLSVSCLIPGSPPGPVAFWSSAKPLPFLLHREQGTFN